MNFYFIRQAWASIKTKPGFIFSVVTSLGVPLGALLSVLTLSYFILVNPLPYPQQDKLMKIDYHRYNQDAALQTEHYLHPAAVALYRDWQKQQQSPFDELALIYYGEEVQASDNQQRKLTTSYITPGWFSLLAPAMALGQAFPRQEDINSFTPGAVLSYQSWQQIFQGDKDILGKRLLINGISHPVIGVTAKNFIEPQLFKTGYHSQLWLPWDYNNSEFQQEWRFIDNRLVLAGRLKNNTSVLEAEQSLTASAQSLFVEQTLGQAFYRQWQVKITLNTFAAALASNSHYLLSLLVVSMAGIVVIAVTNISNLFMAHALSQQSSLAINAALGAKKSQLRLNLFYQSALLMLLASLVALLIAQAGFSLMEFYFSRYLPRADELTLNGFTMSCALVFAFFLAVFFAWAGAKTIHYPKLQNALKTAGKGTGIQVSTRARLWLICTQLSIATSLIFANSLLLNDAIQQLKQPLAFNSEQTLEVEFSVASLNWLGWDHYAPKVKALKQALLLLPEVENISFARSPLNDNFQFPATDISTGERYYPFHRNIDHQYLEVIGQRLLAGTGFSRQDVREQTPVVIVNDTFAQMLAADHTEVLGKKIAFDQGTNATIIAVVQDLQLPSKRRSPPRLYLTNLGTATFMLIKLKPHTDLSREQMIQLLKQADSQFVLSRFEKISESVARERFPQKLTAFCAITLAGITILLSAIGLFGVFSYATGMRRIEIGTRLAIGAKGKDILYLLLKDNARAILLGMLTSILTLVVLLFTFNQALNTYISWQILPVFLATLAITSLISWCACYFPLRRYTNQAVVLSLRNNR